MSFFYVFCYEVTLIYQKVDYFLTTWRYKIGQKIATVFGEKNRDHWGLLILIYVPHYRKILRTPLMPDITLDSKFKTSNKTYAFVQIKNDAKNIQNDVVLFCCRVSRYKIVQTKAWGMTFLTYQFLTMVV